MKKFKDWSLNTKILSGFAFVLLIAGAIGVVGVREVSSMMNKDEQLDNNVVVPLSQIAKISTAFQRIRVNTRDLLLAENIAERQMYAKKIEGYRTEISTLADEFEKTIVSDSLKKTFGEFQEARKVYAEDLQALVGLAMSNQTRDGFELLKGDMRKDADREMKLIDEMMEAKIALGGRLTEENASEATAGRLFILIVLAVGSVSAIVVGLLMARGLVRPLKVLISQANRIGERDLTVAVDVASKDEVGELASAFKSMVEQLRVTLTKVGEASAAVASASNEISSSTQQMAAGAEEQTGQTAEVAGAVEEMTKTIIENSQNATNTAETAKKAKRAAEEGGQIVSETVEGMSRIAEVVKSSAETVRTLGRSSEHIGEIVSVIDDIADQTNLLALNAAIEAARAGEQGRGFAVVADEVRKLAERTTRATKEIAGMIKSIQADTRGAVESMERGTKEVDRGIALAENAGVSLHEIVAMIQTLSDMVSQIAAASEQQSSASEQISKNVEAISTVTSESAQGANQIARASEDLNRLTENLRELVGAFRLADSGGTQYEYGSSSGKRQFGYHSNAGVAVRADGRLVMG
jgi:methyl-accepting chemotaxis protein